MGLGLSRAFTPLTLLTHLPYSEARRSPGIAARGSLPPDEKRVTSAYAAMTSGHVVNSLHF